MDRQAIVEAVRANMTTARARLIEASQKAHVVHGDDSADQFLQSTYELRVIADDLARRQSAPGTLRTGAPIITRIQENLNETCDSLAIAAAHCSALDDAALARLKDMSENFLSCAREILVGIDDAQKARKRAAS